MAITPFWDDRPQAWDQVSIGQFTLPGVCEVRGEVSRKIDAQSASGSDGARVVDKGYEPAKFKITVRIWTEEHLEQWEAMLPILNPRWIPRDKQGKRVSWPIYSASLAQMEITHVYITGISFLEPGPKPGIRESTITCVEHARPSQQNVTHTVKPGQRIEDRRTAVDAATPADTEGHPFEGGGGSTTGTGTTGEF